MISFECDYNNGVHPNILQRMLETNDEHTVGYGFDQYSEVARQKIKTACETPDADVYLLVGGTQTNSTVIDSFLQSYEGVISADTGHLNTHEAGAIESTRHKVIYLPNDNGKLSPKLLDEYMDNFVKDSENIHCVSPALVYISFPTELGTLYSASELDTLYQTCHKYDLPLFIDGARLGYGLASPDNDITLPYLAHHCDAFYIGGTKVGAMFGEAVVFTHHNGNKHFFTIQKQHGAVLAKGRFLGLQFDTLFTDNLYMNISHHAIEMAQKMKQIFADKGYRFYVESPTNQQFIIIENKKAEQLAQNVRYTTWGPLDSEHTICRFVTSWSTPEESLEQLSELL